MIKNSMKRMFACMWRMVNILLYIAKGVNAGRSVVIDDFTIAELPDVISSHYMYSYDLLKNIFDASCNSTLQNW